MLDDQLRASDEADSARARWLARFRATRQLTTELCQPLEIEDYVVQSMDDVSPPKWHLAHTTWFFETFLLEPFAADYRPFHSTYGYLFNSYYQTVGAMHPRHRRGLLSRPTVADIDAYRRSVDQQMEELIAARNDDRELTRRLEIGLHHEQQHQELLLMDIKHILSTSPLEPAYRELAPAPNRPTRPLGWIDVPGGVHEIGHRGKGFAYDNETPRHRVLVGDCQLADRLVTCGEWLDFMADGGYERPELWLSDGWATVDRERWRAPLYWRRRAGGWYELTLTGPRPIDRNTPVVHVSYYEAEAFARWAGARLPTEAEWEVASNDLPIKGNFVDDELFHPAPAGDEPGLRQMFGDVWELTASPYLPYPGFEPLPGALGEYNGKFMSNQQVLRGGSCATSRDHVRASYRNFFYPHQRWCFQGLRIARDR